MRRSLSELICDDLADLAHLESDVIASEEAIRVMMTMFKDKGLLSNITFVHKEQFQDFLKQKLGNVFLVDTPAHYQFIIEVGERSKAKQRTPETIHYCALDLYFRPGKQPLAFVADHYQGHNGYYNEFAAISKNLGIQFVVAGGETYQADSVHCPIFTQMHLLLSASDDGLLTILEDIVKEQNEPGVVKFNWDKLAPKYMLYSQSVSMLLKYVDTVKNREGSPKNEASQLLVESKFSDRLSSTLFPLVSKSLDLRGKLRNKGIKYLAADFASGVVLELEKNPSSYDEQKLIDICYKERYPLVYQVLSDALIMQKAYPYIKDSVFKAHPLFELAFYHANVLEFCLKKTNFKKIFTDKSMLELMQKDLISPYVLFAKLTNITKNIEVTEEQCRKVVNNLDAFAIIVKNLDVSSAVNQEELLGLLFSSKTKAFFQNDILAKLFFKGLISVQMIEKIVPFKIEKGLLEKLQDDNKRMDYLEEKFSLTPPSEVEIVLDGLEDNKNIEDSEDLYSIPEPDEVEEFSTTSEKPPINVGLLIQSMSNSIFLSPEKELGETVDRDERKLEVVYN